MVANAWHRQAKAVADQEKTPWQGRKKPQMWNLDCTAVAVSVSCSVRTPRTAFGEKFFGYMLFHTSLLELRRTYNYNVTCLPLEHVGAEGAAKGYA